MSYYVRAFCTANQVPTPASVLDELAARGVALRPESDDALRSIDWNGLALVYKPAKSPIVVGCHRVEDEADSLARKEIEEFVAELAPPRLSRAKRRVINHLKSTRFVIACCLPMSDIDDDGYDANGELLRYFVDHCGGMIQADGEGFYDGTRLIVRLE